MTNPTQRALNKTQDHTTTHQGTNPWNTQIVNHNTTPITTTTQQHYPNTNQTTTLHTTNTPTTTQGLQTNKTITNNTTNTKTIKTTQGNIYNIQAYNTTNTPTYLKLYNQNHTNINNTTNPPIKTLPIPPNSGYIIEITHGLHFTQGITITITKQLPDNDNTPTTENDSIINIDYN